MTELWIFDDFDRLVLAGLALKRALLQAGSIRLYSREPHRRAATWRMWDGRFPVKLRIFEIGSPIGSPEMTNSQGRGRMYATAAH